MKVCGLWEVEGYNQDILHALYSHEVIDKILILKGKGIG